MRKFGSILLASLAALWLLSACCGGGSSTRVASKDATSRCRVSAFDYYCALRPPNWGHDSPQAAFGTGVFSAMKAQGYKVYLVSYSQAESDQRWETVQSRTSVSGYGQRDFFGDATRGAGLVGGGVSTGRNTAEMDARSGYGFRNFFGDHHTARSQVTTAASDGKNQPASQPRPVRHVVVWENRPGQYFLVDGPYAEPQWVAGSSWLDRVRFHDPKADAVETVRS